jgi:membrane-bound metal-dependent hydrolase YbcI (DUF457 family)
MYAVGHLALGYLSGKTASKILNVNINIPLLFLVSVLPDVDLLIPGLEHRGPTHSVIVLCLLFLPSFMFFRKRAIPYFVALIQHILIGDYLTGSTQLLWPITTNWYSLGLGIEVTSLTNIFIEWVLFLVSITIMFKTKDAWLLFQQHSSNMIISIPVLTVLLPMFLSFPLGVPLELVIPHLIYIALFTFSILMDWKAILTKTGKRNK